jgi:hypothetical protein
MSQDDWKKTKVAQASSYFCGKCSKSFPSPEAVYRHLDAEHGAVTHEPKARPKGMVTPEDGMQKGMRTPEDAIEKGMRTPEDGMRKGVETR